MNLDRKKNQGPMTSPVRNLEFLGLNATTVCPTTTSFEPLMPVFPLSLSIFFSYGYCNSILFYYYAML